MEQEKTLPNHKNKPYGGAWAIEDDTYINAIDDIITTNGESLSNTVPGEFIDHYKQWFQSSHNIQGISTFDKATCSLGTTETFDKFYMYNRNRRLRLFKGEYFYHQMVARKLYKDNWAWMDDEILPGDVLVFSLPFADTGSYIHGLDKVFDQCDTHGVPVLIDMAYINLARGMQVDLSRDCIKVVTTSLSKVFPVQYHRIGMRLTKDIDDDLMIAYQQNNYVNRFGCGLGIEMMKRFGADHTHKAYESKQKQLCNELGIEVSPCVIFGVDHTGKYQEYSRGGTTNRLCFSNVWNKKG
jgi:hypothetical protein